MSTELRFDFSSCRVSITSWRNWRHHHSGDCSGAVVSGIGLLLQSETRASAFGNAAENVPRPLGEVEQLRMERRGAP